MAEDDLMYSGFLSVRFFKITFGVIYAPLTFCRPTLKQLRVIKELC